MTGSPPPTAPRPPALRLMLVDDDAVFRLGLRIWLEQSAGHQVAAEAGTAEEALAILDQRATGDLGLDLVILDLGLGTGAPDQIPGLGLCADLKTRYPALPVLVLSARAEPVLRAAAQQSGADGFGARGMAVGELDRLIRQLTRPVMPPDRSPTSPLRPNLGAPEASAPTAQIGTGPEPRIPRPLRQRLWQSSVQQIDAAMAQIEAEQRRGRGSLLAEAVLAGRYRELRAARWLMGRLWVPAAPPANPSRPATIRSPRSPETRLQGYPAQGYRPQADRPDLAGGYPPLRPGVESRPGEAAALAIAPEDRLTLNPGDLATLVFERVFGRLQGRIDNTSGTPMEIDILREDKKRELLYLILRKVEDVLEQLRRAGVPPGQLHDKAPLVLRDLWEACLTDYFGRYYALPLGTPDQPLEQPVVPTLLTEAAVVQAAILDRIPLVPLLLGHLLFNESVVVDGSLYEAAAPAAMARSQDLLEHLLIQLANAVVQPLLNHFADVELMKKSLYQRRMMTSRDIERFRNDLSWRYRWDGLINEPRAIFESQHCLWHFTDRGLQTQTIYAPRRNELDQLSGLQRAVTLVVEARDAVAPRFRSAVALVGSGVVYVLTDVIGRGIGLIGRGILRSVGGGWRDPRYRRDGQDD